MACLVPIAFVRILMIAWKILSGMIELHLIGYNFPIWRKSPDVWRLTFTLMFLDFSFRAEKLIIPTLFLLLRGLRYIKENKNPLRTRNVLRTEENVFDRFFAFMFFTGKLKACCSNRVHWFLFACKFSCREELCGIACEKLLSRVKFQDTKQSH